MKKNVKTGTKLLPLSKETIRKINDSDLKGVIGGGSCLEPPLPKS